MRYAADLDWLNRAALRDKAGPSAAETFETMLRQAVRLGVDRADMVRNLEGHERNAREAIRSLWRDRHHHVHGAWSRRKLRAVVAEFRQVQITRALVRSLKQFERAKP